MNVFIQQIINGITLGSIYALIALGYTMVYGILELINFAHGEVYMMGAYIGLITLSVLTIFGLPEVSILITLIIIFLMAMIFSSAYGYTIEKIAYRPLRNAPRLSPMISALGMSFFLQNFVRIAQGAREKFLPELIEIRIFNFMGATVNTNQIVIMVVTVILMILLILFIKKTRMGKAMRATAQDKVMASLLGINIDKVISYTFIIGSALAAFAGVLVAMYYGKVDFFMGFTAGIKAFTAAVLGGIGSIGGAMLGGLLIGIIEAFSGGYISTAYQEVFVFLVLVLVLIFKPGGLLGKQHLEKV